jgi:hypothetical protein
MRNGLKFRIGQMSSLWKIWRDIRRVLGDPKGYNDKWWTEQDLNCGEHGCADEYEELRRRPNYDPINKDGFGRKRRVHNDGFVDPGTGSAQHLGLLASCLKMIGRRIVGR